MPSPIREKNVVARVRQRFAEAGGKSMKTEGEGEPDVVGSVAGLAVAVECKTPGNEPTVLQRQRLREWAKSGAAAGWTDDGETLHVYGPDGPKYDMNLQRFLHAVLLTGTRAAQAIVGAESETDLDRFADWADNGRRFFTDEVNGDLAPDSRTFADVVAAFRAGSVE